jgi:hypothetical protein
MKLRRAFRREQIVLATLFFPSILHSLAVSPVVTNVRNSQRAGKQLVDVHCDLANACKSALTVTVAVSTKRDAACSAPVSPSSRALISSSCLGTSIQTQYFYL